MANFLDDIRGNVIGYTGLEERQQIRINKLEEELRRSHQLLRKSEEEMERLKKECDVREKRLLEEHEGTFKSFMNQIKEKEKTHDDEIRKIQEENTEATKNLNLTKNDFLKTEVAKLKLDHAATLTKLDERFEKMKREAREEREQWEKENVYLRVKHREEMKEQMEFITKLEADRRNDQKEAMKVQQKLESQILDEQVKILHLEHQLKVEATREELEEELNQKIMKSATQGVMKEFLKITKTVQDTLDSLRYIQSYCSGDITGSDLSSNIEVNLQEVWSSKAMFKEEVHRFEQFLIDEQSAHDEVLRVCKECLHKFENLMDSDNLVNLCTQLPSAIENKEPVQIQIFGKMAGNLSRELKDQREEINDLLGKLSCGNFQKQIE